MEREEVNIWIGFITGIIISSVLWNLYVFSIKEEIATKKPMQIGYEIYTCEARSLK